MPSLREGDSFWMPRCFGGGVGTRCRWCGADSETIRWVTATRDFIGADPDA